MDAKHSSRIDRACRFCGIPNWINAEKFDLPIAESEHFFAVASIGGFVPGWTLVCPKEHCLNLAGLYGTAEFVEFSNRVGSAVSHAYGGPVAVFEHGCRHAGSLAGCGTDHAHLHLVPFRESLAAVVRHFDPTGKWITGRAQDVNLLVGDQEYLLMANSIKDLSRAALMRGVEVPQAQYFRIALASSLGLEESRANYRAYPFIDLATQTASRLHADLRNSLKGLEQVA
jgi:diadenosine tetraphosphate (Ap4A) HIT family hydrolase